jgi:F-type H+-transporting ATPase subunit b
LININVTLGLQLINFLLLMFLLNHLLFRPIVRLLDERSARTEGRVADAERAEAEADAMLADYEAKVREVRGGADQARGEVLRKADAERQDLLAQATEEAAKTVAEIRARVRGETEQARQALQAEANQLATAAAARILGRAV